MIKVQLLQSSQFDTVSSDLHTGGYLAPIRTAMSTRRLSPLPRYSWYTIGIFAIGSSHLTLLTGAASAELLPVVTTALCVMCTQRHVVGLSLAAAVAGGRLGLWQVLHQLPSNTIWPVVVANVALGGVRLAFVRGPHGPLRSQPGLFHRLWR